MGLKRGFVLFEQNTRHRLHQRPEVDKNTPGPSFSATLKFYFVYECKCNKEFSPHLLNNLKEFLFFVSAHLEEIEMLAFEGKKM